MSIKISELPPELQEVCHQRQREQGNDGTFNGCLEVGKRNGNFNWNETPENAMWQDVYNGRDITKHPCYPHPANYSIY